MYICVYIYIYEEDQKGAHWNHPIITRLGLDVTYL